MIYRRGADSKSSQSPDAQWLRLNHGHVILGRVALAGNDLPTARAELLAAAHTPGSPQLNSFGPNMRLAQDLLGVDERDVVLVYINLCRVFWEMGGDRAAQWTSTISDGRIPDFGRNVAYCSVHVARAG